MKSPVARIGACAQSASGNPGQPRISAPPAGKLQSGLQFSVDAARRELGRTFRQDGLDTPDLDARLLVGHALTLDHAALVAAAERTLSAAEAQAIARVAARRLAGEPVARITGTKEFWGLDLRLDPETLVPRPDSETVVEAALAALGPERAQRALRVADLGTGSGALLLALLSELPGAHGIGTDTSLAALECARANAATLGLADRAAFVRCDYGAAFAGSFDLVVSNPPYVRSGEIATLMPEVRLYDPLRALDGGSDGLDGCRAIAADASRLIAPRGILVVEFGAGRLAVAQSLFTAAGLTVLSSRSDLSGVPRALVLRRD
jgi:release factor glutamine methyltransferase